MRHVVDGELARGFALRDALGENACRGAMRRRHPVANEQDDVSRLALARLVNGPRDLARMRAVARPHDVAAGFLQRTIAQDDGRHVPAVLAFDEVCGLSKHLGMVLTIQGDVDLRGVRTLWNSILVSGV